MANIPLATYKNWEAGRSAPRLGQRLRNLCRVLRLEPKELLAGEEEA